MQNGLKVFACFTFYTLLGIGMGLVLLSLNSEIPLVDIVWKSISRHLYLSSNVLITADNIPVQYYDELAWHPFFQLGEFMRTAFFPTYDTTQYFNDWFYVFCWILGLWLVGLVLQRKWLWWILRSE